MRVLVLGASGMMGLAAAKALSENHQVMASARVEWTMDLGASCGVRKDAWIPGLDVFCEGRIASLLAMVQPHAVVNCVGVVKQLPEASDATYAIRVNSLFPHVLARLCSLCGARLIHMSTDCVFSGMRGGYKETDHPDPVDLYGRSKLLGETQYGNSITLRTSIIGRQWRRSTGLIEWFISQRGRKVTGFERAIFSGLTTSTLARVIASLLETHVDLRGLFHVASAPISKHDLLSMVNARLQLGVEIERDASHVCNRSLDGSRFHAATGIVIPSWESMIDDLVAPCLAQ